MGFHIIPLRFFFMVTKPKFWILGSPLLRKLIGHQNFFAYLSRFIYFWYLDNLVDYISVLCVVRVMPEDKFTPSAKALFDDAARDHQHYSAQPSFVISGQKLNLE